MSKCSCEILTFGGFYDPHGWCHLHSCPGCNHAPHPLEGCPVPDYRTGWCECERGWIGNGPRQLIHNGRKPR